MPGRKNCESNMLAVMFSDRKQYYTISGDKNILFAMRIKHL